jgi:hypothetical protein
MVAIAKLETPLGNLIASATFNPGVSKEESLSIVLGRFKAITARPQLATDCFGVVLTLHPQAVSGTLSFGIHWELEPPSSFSYATGEHLDAASWEDGAWILLIGTEDEEILSLRLQANEKVASLCHEYPCRYTNGGLERQLWVMPSANCLTLHFAVAWGHNSGEYPDSPPWLAVDVNHEVLKARLGVFT